MLGVLPPSVGAFHIRNVVMRCCQKSLMIPAFLFVGVVLADSAAAQWVNRYSKWPLADLRSAATERPLFLKYTFQTSFSILESEALLASI